MDELYHNISWSLFLTATTTVYIGKITEPYLSVSGPH
jgi:hypothetical protein